MQPIRDILEDIRKRLNLDIYITVFIALLVAILGVFQIPDPTVISSAVLAVLALVSLSLLTNRRENDDLRRALGQIGSLDTRLNELSARLGVTVTFIPWGERRYEGATTKLQSLIADAHEFLILDYNPLEEQTDTVRYALEDKTSEARRLYYASLIDKIRKSKLGTFRYRRILQVPSQRQVADIIADDPIFSEHCQELVKIGEKQPEIASLKRCLPVYEATYIIVDRRVLVMEMNMVDPDTRYYRSGATFFFDDAAGTVISSYLQFFERADANSVLVRATELSR